MKEANAAGAYVTTAIRIPRAVHQLLQMAMELAARHGGRVSVSGVLAEMALERQGGDQREVEQVSVKARRHGACGAT